MPQRFGEAGGQAMGLSSLETGLGFLRIAAESPYAYHDFEFREPFPDLLAHYSRRRERVRRQRRDAYYIARSGINRLQPFIGRRPSVEKDSTANPFRSRS